MANKEEVLVERMPIEESDQYLALVTLNRPDEMNPLDWDTVLKLGGVFEELEKDESVRVVALTGAGRAFSAGGDMKKYATLQRDSVDFPQFLDDIHRIFAGISQSAKPYIALVNGIAVAGGIELILSCDLAIASKKARVGDAHLVFGQMGGGGALTLLPRVVGPARARELVFTGRTMDAEEARDFGIVSNIVEPEELLDAALEFAASVAAKSPLAVANAKRIMNASWSEGTGIPEGLRLERTATSLYCLTSEDAPEGLEAFAQKRPANYTGR